MKNNKKVVVKTVKVENKSKDKKKKKAKKSGKSKMILTTMAPGAIGTQVNRGEFYKTTGNPKYPGSIRVRGHELLQMVNTNNVPTESNTLAALVFLNPTYFTGTRVAKLATLYEKFKFNKMKFHFASSRPTTAAGQYLMAHDTDYADDTPGTDDDGTRAYFAMKASMMRNVWESGTLMSKLTDPQDFYYTNDTGFDGRLVYQGQLYVALLNAGITTTVNLSGSLWMEYELDLFDPQSDTNLYKPTAISARDKNYDYNYSTPDSNDFWNNYDTLQVAKPLQLITDSDGNKCIRFPPGLWQADWSTTTKDIVGGDVNAIARLVSFKQGQPHDVDNYGEFIESIQYSIPNLQSPDQIFFGSGGIMSKVAQGLSWYINVDPIDKFKDVFLYLEANTLPGITVLPFLSSIFNFKKATSYPLGYGEIGYLLKSKADLTPLKRKFEDSAKNTTVEPAVTPSRNRSVGRV